MGKGEGKGEGKDEGEGEGKAKGKGEGKGEGKDEGEGKGEGDGKGEGKGKGKGKGEGKGKGNGEGNSKGKGKGEGKGDGKGEGDGKGDGKGKGLNLSDDPGVGGRSATTRDIAELQLATPTQLAQQLADRPTTFLEEAINHRMMLTCTMQRPGLMRALNACLWESACTVCAAWPLHASCAPTASASARPAPSPLPRTRRRGGAPPTPPMAPTSPPAAAATSAATASAGPLTAALCTTPVSPVMLRDATRRRLGGFTLTRSSVATTDTPHRAEALCQDRRIAVASFRSGRIRRPSIATMSPASHLSEASSQTPDARSSSSASFIAAASQASRTCTACSRCSALAPSACMSAPRLLAPQSPQPWEWVWLCARAS